MAVRDYPVSFQNTAVNYTASSGTILSCLQAEASGKYISNFPGFVSAGQFLAFGSFLPTGSTIDQLELVCSARGTSGTGGPFLSLRLSPSNGQPVQNLVDQILTGSFAEYSIIYTGFGMTLLEIFDSFLEVFASAGVVFNQDVEYLAWRITYTPPPDGLVMVYVAGAYPVECPQPPAKRFRKFGIYNTADGLEQNVTAAWMAKYGKPPAGYVLWNYYRGSSYDFALCRNSPVSAWSLDPWPPPN